MTKAKEDFVEVRITASQEVHYNQIKRIPRTIYIKYLQMVDDEADEREFALLADLLINPDDVCDADDFEDIQMQPYVREK